MSHQDNKLEQAYERMMDSIHQWAEKAKAEGRSLEHWFKEAAEEAVDKEIDLEILTREEALKVRDFIARDLHEASSFMKEAGEDIKFWFDLDKEYLEDSFVQAFKNAADPTELDQFMLTQELKARAEYHTGEIASMGVLQCKQCGEKLHFSRPGHIPPCPKCHGTVFEWVDEA